MKYELKFDKLNMKVLGKGVFLYKLAEFRILDITEELFRKLINHMRENEFYNITYNYTDFIGTLSMSYMDIEQLLCASTGSKQLQISMTIGSLYSVTEIELFAEILADLIIKCNEVIATEYSIAPTKWAVDMDRLTIES